MQIAHVVPTLVVIALSAIFPASAGAQENDPTVQLGPRPSSLLRTCGMAS
jgi:hypothetical protein